VFGWFASWHTFLPMLFARVQRKPSILVIGGYDLANVPDIGYGHQRGGFKKHLSRATMRLARRLITNSHFSAREACENAALNRGSARVIYHGVPDRFGDFSTRDRELLAITIGNVDRPNLARKGLEPFVAAATLLPEVRFVVVGTWKDDAIEYLRSIAGPNVEFTGWVDDATLDSYYCRAAVYVQASRHEGFGIAVAEAMLAGCIPVVTREGALPEVAGESGVYLDRPQPAEVARGVAQALGMPGEARVQARQRILTHFPMHNREAALAAAVAHLLDSTPALAACIPSGTPT
jgi:glycosyltransferase involved in cell wall biosynthesis